jgi:hypothetical protein
MMRVRPVFSSLLSPALASSLGLLSLSLVGAAGCSTSAETADVVIEPWGGVFGGSGTSSGVTAVAVASSGNVALAGFFTGSIDFGGGALESTAEPNIFLTKLDTAGDHLWSGRTGGGDDFARGIAFDRGGGAIVGGMFTGFVDFGDGGELTGANDVFLARFGAGGSPIWSRRFGADANSDTLADIATDDQSGIYLMGSANGNIDFGLGPLNPGQFATLYVAKINTLGKAVFSIGFSTFSYCEGRKMAIDPAGNIYVLGDFYGEVDFGGGPIGGFDSYGVFVLKLDKNGHHVWSRGITSDFGNTTSSDIAADREGNVYVTGNFGGGLNFPGGSLSSGDSYNDIYLAKLDSEGFYAWGKAFGSDFSYQQVVGLAVSEQGQVHIAGTFEAPIDFGGGPLDTTGNQDIFLARFGADGSHVKSRRFGDTGYQSLTAFALSPGGNPVLAGSFSGSLDFGTHELTAAQDSTSLFVSVVSP